MNKLYIEINQIVTVDGIPMRVICHGDYHLWLDGVANFRRGQIVDVDKVPFRVSKAMGERTWQLHIHQNNLKMDRK